MSRDGAKLVVTFALPRAEDPALFDHLARFRKGSTRTARLKTLVRKGLMLEQLQSWVSDASPQTATGSQDQSQALLDQIFASVEG